MTAYMIVILTGKDQLEKKGVNFEEQVLSFHSEIKAVVRFYTLTHNEELNCTYYLNNSVMKLSHVSTLRLYTPCLSIYIR